MSQLSGYLMSQEKLGARNTSIFRPNKFELQQPRASVAAIGGFILGIISSCTSHCQSFQTEAEMFAKLRNLSISNITEEEHQSIPLHMQSSKAKDASKEKNFHRTNEMVTTANMTTSRIDHWHMIARDANNPEAMYNLGLCYYSGSGVSKNYETAYDWFSKAAEHGFADAKFNLGVMSQLGRGIGQSQEAAEEWYLDAANGNVSEACNNLGRMYQVGVLGKPDPMKAFKFYRKGAHLGNGDAMYNVALCYYKGMGTNKNIKETIDWLEACSISSSASRSKAEYMLGNIYFNGENGEIDYKESVFWYKASAEHGYPPAQVHVGKLLLGSGSRGRQRSNSTLAQGRRFLEMAANNGVGEAWHVLGQYWTDHNKTKAFKCFESAYHLNYGATTSLLASCYEYGWGCQKDEIKAVEMHKEAAKAGWSVSMNSLGSIYLEGREDIYQDKEEALRWFIRAADHGDADAQFQVAIQQIYGDGCDTNMQEARVWLRKAASQGNKKAHEMLFKIYGETL
eukprot:CAMPEP_0167745092 /NCGR_PEP_ID=MMETSP0110_2-20121227/2959_1 /TAXON_ID=629695 /ORGANISM="Gymnochlora sp., Strain CCMP2014" /LENGTH=509 /DNA_ID=CAMNT_0007629695 /DNA_START=95 /DNA_END=1624 /DNA_ORIENTATION=-